MRKLTPLQCKVLARVMMGRVRRRLVWSVRTTGYHVGRVEVLAWCSPDGMVCDTQIKALRKRGYVTSNILAPQIELKITQAGLDYLESDVLTHTKGEQHEQASDQMG